MAKKGATASWATDVRSDDHVNLAPEDEKYLLAVYSALQTRLNEYRKNGLTVGLVVLGIATGIDLFFVQGRLSDISLGQSAFGIVFISVVSVVGCIILNKFQSTFEELSSVIEIIDDRYGAFKCDRYIRGKMLYCFGRTVDISGWQDPTLSLIRAWIIISGIVHFFVYSGLAVWNFKLLG